MEKDLIDKDKLFEAIFQLSNIGICITNEDAKFELVNDAYCKIYGYTREELIGQKFNIVVPPEDRENSLRVYQSFINGNPEISSEWKTIKKDGSSIDVYITAGLLVQEDGRKYKITTVTDITNRKRYERKINYLENYSIITNLPLRHVFENKLSKALDEANHFNAKVFVVMVDLDRFKFINDNYGFNVGDKLLMEVGIRIRRCLKNKDLVAYFGEDHFAIMLEKMYYIDEVAAIVENARGQISKSFFIDGNELNVTSSIGISIFPDESKNIRELIIHAEKAIEQAKIRGKNFIQFYTKELNNKLSRRLRIESDLKDAIKNNELYLMYQPQISLSTGKMVGVEALIRWSHHSLGVISPAEFIPIAEETGQIIDIGEWVIKTACKQAKLWKDKKLLFFNVAVNISSIQLAQDNLVSNIERVIKETGILPETLEVELTESSMIKDIEKSISIFRRLERMGIKIAIDDFGTGYSSLSYLKKIPINKLKIDRSFIVDLGSDFDSSAITRTIIDMSKNLGFKVIAEGAETIEHINYLKENRCDEVQGYFFSKPLLPNDLENFINRL